MITWLIFMFFCYKFTWFFYKQEDFMSNPATVVWAAISNIYGTFSDKTAAERNYKAIVPAIQTAIDGGQVMKMTTFRLQ